MAAPTFAPSRLGFSRVNQGLSSIPDRSGECAVVRGYSPVPCWRTSARKRHQCTPQPDVVNVFPGICKRRTCAPSLVATGSRDGARSVQIEPRQARPLGCRRRILDPLRKVCPRAGRIAERSQRLLGHDQHHCYPVHFMTAFPILLNQCDRSTQVGGCRRMLLVAPPRMNSLIRE